MAIDPADLADMADADLQALIEGVAALIAQRQKDRAAAAAALDDSRAATVATVAADIPKLREAIASYQSLLADNTTAGSIRAWKASAPATYSAAAMRSLADLLIADVQASRVVARQALRLAMCAADDYRDPPAPDVEG